MEVPPLGLPANIHDPPRGTGSATKDEVSREQRGMVDDSKYPPFTEVVQMFESQCGGEHNMKNAHTSRAQEQHREAKELIGNSAEQDDGSLDTASERSWGKRLPLAFETDPIRLEKIMTRAIRVEMLSDKRQRDEGENKTSGVSENLSPHSDQDGQLGPYLSKSESRPSNPRFIQNGSRWQVAVGEQRGIARLNFEKKCTEEAEPKRAAPQGLLSPKGVTQFIF